MPQRSASLQACIDRTAAHMAAEASPGVRAVHRLLLPLTPDWDADTRWGLAMQITSAAVTGILPTDPS